MAKERVQINYVGYCVRMSDAKKGLLHLATGHVVGGYLAVKGVYENDSGLISYTRPDGDKIFMTYKCSGVLGKSAKGTYTYVGGTGKYAGIKGDGEFTRLHLQPPSKGMWSATTLFKGNWKLP